MLRTALRPRWLALLAVVLVAATAMSMLGQWQLGRARDRGADAVAAEPVALLDVLQARQGFPTAAKGRLVEATGSWDGARQLLVPGRELDGRAGLWVLTPLRLTDGSAVPVVRGWVRSPSDPAAGPATGTVRVVGRLEPAEPPAQRAPGEGSGLPPGQLARVATPDLIGVWPYPLLTGHVVLQSLDPAGAGPAPRPLPASAVDSGLNWRNLSYALQWWTFAGFGLFFWWRLVRDDAALRRAVGAAAGPPVQTEPQQPPAARPGSLVREHGPDAVATSGPNGSGGAGGQGRSDGE